MSDYIIFNKPVIEEIESLGTPTIFKEEFDGDGKLTIFQVEYDCICDYKPTRNGILYSNMAEVWDKMKGQPFIDTHNLDSWKNSLGHVVDTRVRKEGVGNIGSAIVDIDPTETDFINKTRRKDLGKSSIHCVASKAKKNKDGIIEATVDYWRELSSVLSPGYANSKIIGMYAESADGKSNSGKTSSTKKALKAHETLKKLEVFLASGSKKKSKRGRKAMSKEDDKNNKETLEKLEEALKDPKKKDILEGLVEQDFLLEEDPEKDPEGDGNPDNGKGGKDGKDEDKNKEADKRFEALEKQNKELSEKLETQEKGFKAMKVALHEKRKPSGLPTEESKKTLTEKNKAAFSKLAPGSYPEKEKKE